MLTTTRRTEALPVLRVAARPAYEFILSLVAFATPQRVDSYDVGQAWFDRMSALAGDRLSRQVDQLVSGCEHLVCRLYGLAHDLETPGTAEALVEAVERLDPATLRLTLLGYYAKRTRRRVPAEVILAASRGDAAAQRQLVTDGSDGPECERAFSFTLATSPEQLHGLAVDVLRGWSEIAWPAVQAEAWPAIEREADRLRAAAADMPVDRLLNEATNGAEVLPAPGVEVVEVFPTWVIRPWTAQWEHESSLMVGVPVPDEQLSADPDQPPDRLVRLTRALGDERRLRILRRLTTGDYSLQELAEHMRMPKTTLLHHLVILRSVGIVRVSPGANGKYSFRPGAPLELSRLLDRYLPAAGGPAPIG
jgi:DNA-binding transcriptional ArsR family regulator